MDIATHPDVRPALIREALAAGKHVLAQKPLAEDLDTARELVEEAERLGMRLAVNQNGRWAPAWRVATLLVDRGAVGDVVAVTHLYDHNYGFTLGTVFDGIEHLVLYDYSVHWFDITRCWLEAQESDERSSARVPNAEPASARAPHRGALGRRSSTKTARAASSVASGVLRRRGRANRSGSTARKARSVASCSARERAGLRAGRARARRDETSFELDGTWHSQGFAGTLSELVCAIAEGREPYNSARHNLLSLELTLAACRSAEEDGQAGSDRDRRSVSEPDR